MTSLRETIENFHAYVLETDGAIEAEINGPDGEFRRTRLNVYHDGYALRLLDILGKAYPAIKKLAGDEVFERLGREYLQQFPSHYFSVGDFGQHFHAFLSQHATTDPLWADVALFEWALEESIVARNAPHVTFEDMAKLDPASWAGLRLTLHPSMQILHLFYATPPLWQALIQGKEQPEIARQNEASPWLLWRHNRQTCFRALKTEQLWMIRAIEKGQTFSEVCEGLCEFLEEEKVIQFAAETLRHWITEGVFSEYQLLRTPASVKKLTPSSLSES